MHDLGTPLRTAQAMMCSARQDFRVASARHAASDPKATLNLAQLAAGVAAAAAHLPRAVTTPTTPDAWLVTAGTLHEAVSRAFDAGLGLWEAAEAARTIVTVPDGALVEPGDHDLFGCEPCSEGFDGWTSPMDAVALDALALPIGSPAWKRREVIRAASYRWCRDHQVAVEASGAQFLQDMLADLHSVRTSISLAMAGVPGSTVAASRAKGRVAVRSLVELGTTLPTSRASPAPMRPRRTPTIRRDWRGARSGICWPRRSGAEPCRPHPVSPGLLTGLAHPIASIGIRGKPA